MTILPVVLVLTGRPVAAGVSDADGVAIALVYMLLTAGVGVVAVPLVRKGTARSFPPPHPPLSRHRSRDVSASARPVRYR